MPGNDNLVASIVSKLNEAENIALLGAQIAATVVPFREILFVDNHSTDATRRMILTLATTHPIRLIEQDHAELGLAAAVMSGALAAQGEVLGVVDVDLSHPPGRIKDLLGPTVACSSDVC